MDIDTKEPNEIVKSERENKSEIKVIKNTNNESTNSNNNKKQFQRKRRIFKYRLGKPVRNRTFNRNGNNVSRNRNEKRNQLYNRINRNTIRLIVRNLNKNVNNYDLQKMFEKVGPLKRCGIHYTSLGDSKGIADVEFLYNKDAYKAVKQLDFKNLKGVPIRLEIVGKKQKVMRVNKRKGMENKYGNRRIRRRMQRNYPDRRRNRRRVNNKKEERRIEKRKFKVYNQ